MKIGVEQRVERVCVRDRWVMVGVNNATETPAGQVGRERKAG